MSLIQFTNLVLDLHQNIAQTPKYIFFLKVCYFDKDFLLNNKAFWLPLFRKIYKQHYQILLLLGLQIPDFLVQAIILVDFSL